MFLIISAYVCDNSWIMTLSLGNQNLKSFLDILKWSVIGNCLTLGPWYQGGDTIAYSEHQSSVPSHTVMGLHNNFFYINKL